MRIVAVLLCVVLIVGCSEKDSIPSGIIGKEQMGDILWDIMQADQYAANYIVKDSAKVNVKMETLKLYEEVFRLHKVSRQDFQKSFQFYQDHPDITRTLFDSLIAKGNRMRADSYSHSPASTPSVPAIRPVTGPTGKPPVTAPGKPSVIAPRTLPGTLPNRPPGAFPNRPSGTLPNQPGNMHLPNGFKLGKDSTKFHRKGLPFLPGQNSPGVLRTSPSKDTTKH